MRIDILSIFPTYFENFLSLSIMKRAIQKKILKINLIDIRDFSKDKHKKVDDRPFGGGPGMVLMAPPVVDAIKSVKSKDSFVIYLSPQGKKFNFLQAKNLSQKKHLILLCGNYAGIDERIFEYIDEEISIGDFVLTNGALAAMVVIDATARFIKGVLGNEDSFEKDSFQNDFLFSYPNYTRPVNFENKKVPEVLTSGNHANIEKYRYNEALKKTRDKRFDLYAKHIKIKGDAHV